MAGKEKKAAGDKAGKSQQPVGSTAATTTATAGDSDPSVNSSLPGGARPPMASFPRPAASAASSSMNYNLQQSVTNTIPSQGQTGHQHGDTLGTQQGPSARLRRGSDAAVATGNLKRQRLQGNFGFGHGQPRPPLLQQRDTRGESSLAAPRSLIVLDREPQSPTAIPGHSQTGHQHGGVLGQQQRRNADTSAAAANVKHQMLQQQGNFVFGYWPQQPPPVGYLQQQPPPYGYLQQQGPSAGLPRLPTAARAPRTLNLLDRLGASTSVDGHAPLMCLVCKILPMRTLPYPNTMHHCVCEDCFRAGIACSNCHLDINLGQSSSSAALPQMLPQAGQGSSQAPPVPDVQPTAAEAPETPLCWSCNIRVAPWTTHYPNVPKHPCVCETCFNNGSTACPVCPRRR